MNHDHLPAHMQLPEVTAAGDRWQRHVDQCAVCQQATNTRNACDMGQQLHEEYVVASQEAYRQVNPKAFAPEPHDG